MPNTKSAEKRVRQADRLYARNRIYRAGARTAVKKARALIEAGDPAAATEAVNKAVKALDKAAQKGVIHDNNAARRKSRLMQALHKATAEA
ncbi:30S ribosomal protein S20 [bacterium]|nr:30S ribosomal protein S20 [bacterium]